MAAYGLSSREEGHYRHSWYSVKPAWDKRPCLNKETNTTVKSLGTRDSRGSEDTQELLELI